MAHEKMEATGLPSKAEQIDMDIDSTLIGMGDDLVEMKKLELNLAEDPSALVSTNQQLSEFRSIFQEAKDKYGHVDRVLEALSTYRTQMTKLDLALLKASPDLEPLKRSYDAAAFLSKVLLDYENGEVDENTADAYLNTHMDELDLVRERFDTDSAFKRAFLNHAKVITALATAMNKREFPEENLDKLVEDSSKKKKRRSKRRNA